MFDDFGEMIGAMGLMRGNGPEMNRNSFNNVGRDVFQYSSPPQMQAGPMPNLGSTISELPSFASPPQFNPRQRSASEMFGNQAPEGFDVSRGFQRQTPNLGPPPKWFSQVPWQRNANPNMQPQQEMSPSLGRLGSSAMGNIDPGFQLNAQRQPDWEIGLPVRNNIDPGFQIDIQQPFIPMPSQPMPQFGGQPTFSQQLNPFQQFQFPSWLMSLLGGMY